MSKNNKLLLVIAIYSIWLKVVVSSEYFVFQILCSAVMGYCLGRWYSE